MKRPRAIAHEVRFNVEHPDLCPALMWKGRFCPPVRVDLKVPSTHDHQYWCVFTQACVGPDNGVVEPQVCSRRERSCHRDAVNDYKGLKNFRTA
jgi:hypothetical protein